MAATYLPTLKQLQYLVALRDHGHFGRAAEACFVTQSTLSAGLRELETLIGVVLVERTRRVVRFTPLGERIAAKARRVLREAEELGDMARAAGRPLSGEMRMSVIPTIAPFMLPRILPRLRRDYPDLSCSCARSRAARRARGCTTGAPTACCSRCPMPAARSRSQPLFDDRLFVAFPDDRSAGGDADDPSRRHRRDAAAAARGRALPEGSRARRVQPARTARRGDDAGHLAAHRSSRWSTTGWA